ncbi:hypothetical protein D1B31_05795 [Neobacillus notoginsengisoli]|uniref:Core domain-containing protein n=1 Tax=Neobacillus notoginsengisoli TaxID=1578198 RepID=A0A417YXD5_9BACI|nr:HesB/YadR/YfhF family protein [Neobacillus notoginsengisoli]RHW42148.1 hypothetical protein D1B31_05795 [Neobacillus notoginsengisoli]
MNLQVNDTAAQWYKEEMELKAGTFIRFYVRYGGFSQLQSGFSLGVSVEEPVDPAVTAESEGLIFYIEEKDLWYFDERDVEVVLDKKSNEPIFNHH